MPDIHREQRIAANRMIYRDWAYTVAKYLLTLVTGWIISQLSWPTLRDFLQSSVWLILLALVITFMQFLMACVCKMRCFDNNIELHDKSFFPTKATEMFITGYQDWEDGLYSLYVVQNIVSLVKETGVKSILHVGAGSAYDVKLSHARFEILLPEGTKNVISDIRPHPTFWESQFAHLNGVSYISTPVDAFNLELPEPMIVLSKGMVHHLTQQATSQFIKASLDTGCPWITVDPGFPGPMAWFLVNAFILFSFPLWFCRHLVNNINSVSGANAKARRILDFTLHLPFLVPAMLWDAGTSFLHTYTYLDYVNILQALGHDKCCIEFYPYFWGAMYVCIIRPPSMLGSIKAVGLAPEKMLL